MRCSAESVYMLYVLPNRGALGASDVQVDGAVNQHTSWQRLQDWIIETVSCSCLHV